MHNQVMRLTIIAALSATLAITSCAPKQVRSPLAQWQPSPNFDMRRPALIVLHATEQDSVQQSLHTLSTRNAGGPVSAHYLIGDDGRIYQLVSDDSRAWHAGAGSWGGMTDLNSSSIGIEIDNDGREPFTEAQITALLRLLEDLHVRLAIPKQRVIAHADLAPTRKRDPGALFPWKRLADAGFGRWPAADTSPVSPGFDPWLAMQALGYPMTDRAAAVRAFHRHYRGIDDGDDPDATLDAQDAAILHALTDPSGAP